MAVIHDELGPKTDETGRIEFEFGDCNLVARDTHLALEIWANSTATLERTKQVISGHLIRFGQKDELLVQWE